MYMHGFVSQDSTNALKIDYNSKEFLNLHKSFPVLTLMVKKVCSKCKVEKPIEEFHCQKGGKFGKQSFCRQCAKKKDAIKHRKLHPLPPPPNGISKVCSKCKVDKALTEFEKRDKAIDGRRGVCKECIYPIKNQKTKQKYDTDPIYKANRNATGKKQRIKHKDKIRLYSKIYRKNRRDNDPGFSFRLSLRTSLGNVFKGRAKSARSEKLTGVSFEVARDLISSQFPYGSGWSFIGEGRKLWHLDHRRPKASFDLTDPEQQLICCHISNLQPLSGLDNTSKSDYYNPKDFENEWVYANGYKWRICDNKRTKIEEQ
jgi:hypothetical protein